MSTIGAYTGQLRKLRELATSKLGADKVSVMSDGDVEKWIEGGYLLLWEDGIVSSGMHRPDDEVIWLMPIEAFDDLCEKGIIICVER